MDENKRRPKTCDEMGEVIEQICRNHGLNIYRTATAIKLENEPYMPLVIENVGTRREPDGRLTGKISVAHYYYQNGDACADPDIVFYFERSATEPHKVRWTPSEITQVPAYSYVNLDTWVIKGETPTPYQILRQRSMADLAHLWAENLRAQGFTEPEGERLKVAWKEEG
jgi:hypothetical protein